MKISAIVKGSICLLGLVSVGNFVVEPAAGQAAARGAATVVRPSGSSQSVSGELIAPTGGSFSGDLTITPTITGAGTNQETISSLVVSPATFTDATAATGSGNPFLDAAATALTNATAVEDQAAIIRAGAGTNGFGGLE
ncbi:hypothetical protein LC607_19315 [Nostoc sp. CHAB 5824]|nr:hypothetical protein [Nostoc sp. CHAB 5824]